MSRLCLLAIAAIGTSATSTVADQPRRVGVVVSAEVGVGNELPNILDALAAALRSKLGVDTISGDDVTRRLPPEGLAEDCIAQAPCRNELGRRLDADELLFVVIARVADETQIDSTWADVASGRTTSRPRIVIKSGEEASAVFTELAPTLLPHIEKPKAEIQKPIVVVTNQPAPGRRMTPLAWTALGVGGASLAAGSLFALSARSKFNALERDNCREVVCSEDRVTSGKRRALAADILFTVGVAGTVTSAVLYALSKPDTPAIGVEATPTSATVSLSGAF